VNKPNATNTTVEAILPPKTTFRLAIENQQ